MIVSGGVNVLVGDIEEVLISIFLFYLRDFSGFGRKCYYRVFYILEALGKYQLFLFPFYNRYLSTGKIA